MFSSILSAQEDKLKGFATLKNESTTNHFIKRQGKQWDALLENMLQLPMTFLCSERPMCLNMLEVQLNILNSEKSQCWLKICGETTIEIPKIQLK